MTQPHTFTSYATHSRAGYPYDDALVPQYPPFYDVFDLPFVVRQRDVVSVKSPGFPKNKPQNAYRQTLYKYADRGMISLDVPYWRYPYYITAHTVSCFAGMNPTSTLLGYFDGSHLVTDEEVLTKLRRRVLDAKVNIPVLLAESRSTASMVLDTARRLSRAFVRVKRRDLKGAADVLGVRPIRDRGLGVAGNWLAYKYGWLPLLSDVRGAAEHLARRALSTSYTQTVSVSISRAETTPSVDFLVGGGAFERSFTAQARSKRTSSGFGSVTFFVTNESLREAAQLGFTDPALVAWELVPLSFVVDWFLPVGNFLEQFNAFSGLQVRKCFVNQRTTLELSGRASDGATGSWSESMFSFQRNIYQDPGVSFPQPELPNNDVVGKLLTTLALFRQRF